MSYDPTVFPVQLVEGQRYDPGVRSGGRACRDEVWWTSNTFTQTRGEYQHNAIDIMAPLGARIVAPVSGQVVREWSYRGERRPGVGYSDNGGWNVRMQGVDGNSHFFAHMLEEPKVVSGQHVRAGELLGYVGQTGNAASTCPHLHYQVRLGGSGGSVINPIPKLQVLFDAGGALAKPDSSSGWLWALGAFVLVGGGLYAWKRWR